jgi:hypothetical protein
MDAEHAKFGARWVMGLTAAAAVAVAVYLVVPRAHQAFALYQPAAPLIAQIAGIGLIIGTIAGLVGWISSAALTRTAMVGRGLIFVAALAAGVAVIAVSTAGWVNVATTAERVFAFKHQRTGQPAELATLPQYRRQMALDRVAYQRELRDLDYPRFLWAPALHDPDGLAHARAKIKDARTILAKYQALYLSRVAALKASFERVPASVEAKHAALARLDHALTPEATARLEWWKVNDQIMAEQQAVLADLASAKAPWEAKDGKLTFHGKSDIEKFQGHFATLKALQDKAHTLDLAIAHASDTTDTEMLNGGG